MRASLSYVLPASAASVNATAALTGPTELNNIIAHNARASVCFLKLYQLDATLAVPDQTKTPALTLTLAVGANNIPLPNGFQFPFGVGFRITSAAANADNTAVAANDVLGLNLIGAPL